MMKKIRLTILLSVLAGLIAFTGYFQYPGEVERYYKVIKNEISALKLSLFPYKDEYFTYITIEKQRDILAWLDSGKFDELDNYFRKLTVKFKNDIKYEQSLNQSYRTFRFYGDVKSEKINEWVERDSGKPYALTARAFYFVAKAWQERGNDFISKTNLKQIEGMNTYMKKAYIDIHKSLAIDNKVVSPYVLLVEISAVAGSNHDRERYFEHGIAIAPGSYVIRRMYLSYLEPKWGGSEVEKKAFVKEQLKYLKYNPGLKRLEARYYFNKATTYNSSQILTKIGILEKSLEYDRYWRSLDLLGELYNDQHQYEKTIDVLTESLSRKPSGYWPLMKRGYAYSEINDYTSAGIDYKEGMRLYPDRYNAYSLYISLLKKIRKYDEALSINITMEEKFPVKAWKWLGQRGDLYFEMKQYNNSLDSYKKSVKLKEDNAWAWTRIGIIYQYHLKDMKLARESHYKALEVDDTYFRYYNYAATLYEGKSPDAPEAFRSYLKKCKRSSCDDIRIRWSKRFLACVDRKSTCDFDRHDYQAWI